MQRFSNEIPQTGILEEHISLRPQGCHSKIIPHGSKTL